MCYYDILTWTLPLVIIYSTKVGYDRLLQRMCIQSQYLRILSHRGFEKVLHCLTNHHIPYSTIQYTKWCSKWPQAELSDYIFQPAQNRIELASAREHHLHDIHHSRLSQSSAPENVSGVLSNLMRTTRRIHLQQPNRPCEVDRLLGVRHLWHLISHMLEPSLHGFQEGDNFREPVSHR